MRRLECAEIHEQPWFPAKLRDDVTDTLQFIFNSARLYRPVAARLGEAIRASRTNRVIDLCSGAAGPWIWLQREFANGQCDGLKILLTDRYPNLAAFQRASAESGGAIEFCDEPVDAQEIPERLGGFRTIFSSLHHFSPQEVRAIIRDAVQRGEGIGFFELAKRRPRTIFYACFMPVATLCLMPFVRPFRFRRLFWTYLVPIIPFVMLWDGVLSCLRAYTPEELREMAVSACTKAYKWDIGESGAVNHLLGYPAGAATR